MKESLPECLDAPSHPTVRGLRLIRAHGSAVEHRSCDLQPARPVLSLQSVDDGGAKVHAGLLTEMFGKLHPQERIEFVHRVERVSADQADARNARFAFDLRLATEDVAGWTDRLAQTMLLTSDGFHLGSSAPGGSGEKWHSTYCIRPAGLVLAGAAESLERHRLPHPADLPTWPLTVPLFDPLVLPKHLELAIRIHGFELDDTACTSLHAALMRLLGGSLKAYDARSPVTGYSALPAEDMNIAERLRTWLRAPKGYRVDCVVRASGALTRQALERIAGDVFGSWPFVVAQHHGAGEPPAPGFEAASTLRQGIPGLLPGRSKLIDMGMPRHFAAPTITPPTIGALVGDTACGAQTGRVALSPESRSRHVALFGATGAGKSSLLLQMIAADLADPQRSRGVGLIDPHGDLFERVLQLVPPDRRDDVIVVDCADLSSTACLNPLHGLRDDPVAAQFVIGEIMSLIESLFETKDSTGPVMRSHVRELLGLAIWHPHRNGTLLDATRALEMPDYAEYLAKHCKDHALKDAWERFKRTDGEHGFKNWWPYLSARFTPFTAHPIMKRLLCRPGRTVDIASAMNDRKIILFNLSKGVLQDIECQILGSLILSQFFGGALARARMPPEAREPFHLYVDEFQSFATDSVPRLFAEARKFGLCLTTANQSLGQLRNAWGRTNIAQTVLGNTATKFMFRLGPADTELLRDYYRPEFESQQMSTLPDFHAVVCMPHGNRPLPPFVMHARQTQIPYGNDAAYVVNRSRELHGTSIRKANQELLKLYDIALSSLGE